MPAAAYYSWVQLGRPLEPARPIRELVGGLKAAFPRAAGLFSWYADEAHYTALPPQDHTPYSATGWPVTSPRWVVFATDVMHRPALGVDCTALFPYWLAEAKAGRMPWLKYMIWRAQRYDVRNGWEPVASSSHFDHIHLSARTDHRDTSLGAWSITPPGGDDMELTDRIPLPADKYPEMLPQTSATVSGTLAYLLARSLRQELQAAKTLERLDILADRLTTLSDRIDPPGPLSGTWTTGGTT